MILLIFPPFPDHLSEYPPLGIAYLAAVLEKEKIAVEVLDLGIYGPEEWKEHLSKKLAEVKPQFVGISSLTLMINLALEISKFIKTNYPQTKIVLGGVHPTVRPEQVLRNDSVDYVIRGEGENTFLELIQGDECSKIKGLSYKSGENMVHNPDRELILDLDALPFPALHLFDLKKYSWYPEINLISSRGCPFACYYCFNGVFGRKFRARTAENIIQEMELLNQKYGTTKFYFYDDTFTFNKERVIQFCNLLLEKKLYFEWRCCSRIDTLDPERVDLMKKSGCKKIHFGIESGDPTLIKKIKNITLEQAKQTIKMVNDTGMETRCYFMIGHPWDTKETIKHTIKFATDIDATVSQFSITTPFPNTQLWEMAKELGVISDDNVDWDKCMVNAERMCLPIMRTPTLTQEELLKYYNKAYRNWYLNKFFKALKNPKSMVKVLKRRGFLSLFKSAYKRITN